MCTNNEKLMEYELQDNRAFRDELKEMIARNIPCTLMVYHLNNFKNINDLYSYSFGDLVIDAYIHDLYKEIPSTYRLYRLDGNSFGVLSENENVDDMIDVFKVIQRVAQKTRHIRGLNISLSVSAGICRYPQDGVDSEILYRNAKLALAQARSDIKQFYAIYEEYMSEEAKRDMVLLEELKYSVEHNFEGFELYYQPIMRNEDKSLFGCEALLRFRSSMFPEGISPFVFVPILENSGLILNVGQWIFDTAFAQCAKWCKIVPNFQMNVNVSARQFDDDKLVSNILSTLRKHSLTPSAITIELTESNPAHYESVKKAFDYLRKQGLKTAFDDFGTGYASVDIFRSISGDELKIDRSFLERITYDVTDQILLKSIIDMCKSMGILVCVEGIENSDIEHIISIMSPNLLQGYLYSRPIPASAFEKQFLQQVNVIEKKVDKVWPKMVYEDFRPAKPMPITELFNSLHAGIFQVGMDEEFTFLTCNEGYRRMLGYTAREMEELFSNKALAFVHPDDMQWVNNEIRRQLGQGDVLSSEFRIVRKDGVAIWVHGTGNVVHSAEGNSSLVVTILDIDAEKKEQLELKKRVAMFDKMMNCLPAGIKYIQFDDEFTIDYISDGFLTFLGYTQQEVQQLFGGKFLYMVYEEDRQQAYSDMLEQLKTGNILHLRYRVYCKNGKLLWLDTITRLCEVDEDGIQRCCSFITDIGGEEKAIVKADHISKRLQEAGELWGDIIFEYDLQRKEISFSQSIETIAGYVNKGEGVDIETLFDTNTDLFYKALEIAKRGEHPKIFETQIRKADNCLLWCKVLMNAADKENGKAVTVLGRISDNEQEHKEYIKRELEEQVDLLTELSSKGVLEEKVNALLQQQAQSEYALFVLDIDDFKEINRVYGRFMGDMVLKTLALRIRNVFRDNDIIGRVGGDEYLIVIHYNKDIDLLHKRCQRLLDTITSPMKFKDCEPLLISASVGIACSPQSGMSFAELYENADKAMYQVKHHKKNDYLIYE